MAETPKAQVGLVGLGTMGSALAEALARAEFDVHAVEPMAEADVSVNDGVNIEPDLATLVAALIPPRCILLMVTEMEKRTFGIIK